jgi:hypothetical protein
MPSKKQKKDEKNLKKSYDSTQKFQIEWVTRIEGLVLNGGFIHM